MWNIPTTKTHSKWLVLIPSHFCFFYPISCFVLLGNFFPAYLLHFQHQHFHSPGTLFDSYFCNKNMIYRYFLREVQDDHTFCCLDLVNCSEIYSAVTHLGKSHPCLLYTMYSYLGLSLNIHHPPTTNIYSMPSHMFRNELGIKILFPVLTKFFLVLSLSA